MCNSYKKVLITLLPIFCIVSYVLPVFAYNNKTYPIDEIGVRVTLSDSYRYVATQSKILEGNFRSLGYEPNEIEEILKDRNIYLDAITYIHDGKTDQEFYVMCQDLNSDSDDINISFNDISDEDIKAFVDYAMTEVGKMSDEELSERSNGILNDVSLINGIIKRSYIYSSGQNDKYYCIEYNSDDYDELYGYMTIRNNINYMFYYGDNKDNVSSQKSIEKILDTIEYQDILRPSSADITSSEAKELFEGEHAEKKAFSDFLSRTLSKGLIGAMSGGLTALGVWVFWRIKKKNDRDGLTDDNTQDRKDPMNLNNSQDYMYCRKCGTKIPRDSTFCLKCGEKIVNVGD